MPALKDLTGMQFGRWTVIKQDMENKGKGARWICQCSCENHTIRSVKGQALRNGRSRSCGCLQKEIAASTKIDMTGKIFGKLTVLYQDKIHKDEAYWICQCECGTITNPIRGTALRTGRIASCGCVNSIGEEKIKAILNKNGKPFKAQFYFQDLIGDSKPLRFDFLVKDIYEQPILIEYQGVQHYIDEGGTFGGENFIKRQEYDNKKRQYCKEHCYKLLEIPYWDFDNIGAILRKENIL